MIDGDFKGILSILIWFERQVQYNPPGKKVEHGRTRRKKETQSIVQT